MKHLTLVNFISLIVLISVSFCIFLSKKKNRVLSLALDELYLKIRKEIQFSVAPKFIDMSLSVNDLVVLAIDVWRLEQRIIKNLSAMPEHEQIGIQHAIKKIKKYLEKCDVEILDYTGKKFNEGLNLDILSVENSSECSQSIVKETIEPTIMHKGMVIKKAKIILLNPRHQG